MTFPERWSDVRLVTRSLIVALPPLAATLLLVRSLFLSDPNVTDLRAAALVCTVLVACAGAAAVVLCARGLARRVREIHQNVVDLATGGALPLLPDGLDEIGRLRGALARVAQTLRCRSSALDQAFQGIAQADASGRYLSFNSAWVESAAFSEGSLPETLRDTVHPQDREMLDAAVDRMRRLGRAECEVRIPQSGGTTADVLLLLIPLSRNPVASYYAFLRDISAWKQAEAALVRARDAAIASNETRTRFLAKISHDIRTPLNAMLGAAEMFSRTNLDGGQAEYLNLFQRNCRRLLVLLNDFLDFSRCEARAVRIQKAPFQLRPMLEDSVATFRDAAQRKGLDLELEIGPGTPAFVLGDSGHIQQVLVNLLSNAIKFTVRGRVSLRVYCIQQRLRFEVVDTGPGIDPAYQDRIFVLFEQTPDEENAHRGSGLGLAICRELVHLMGGEIDLASQPGSGSMFHFSIPLESAMPAEAVVSPVLTSVQGHPLRILIAEDSEDNRLLIGYYLSGEPVELSFAGTGHEAFQTIRESLPFNLVLMDLDLPGLDGHAAAHLIREWEAGQGRDPVPVVALSANSLRESVQASLDAGCVDHVAKPIDRDTLLQTICCHARFPVDADSGAALTGACPDSLAELVPRYLARKTEQITEVLRSFSENDFDSVRRFGHNLRGTAAGYGFPRMEEIGCRLESAAQRRDRASIAEQLHLLQSFLASVNPGTRDLINLNPLA